jgi:hypothetical protein
LTFHPAGYRAVRDRAGPDAAATTREVIEEKAPRVIRIAGGCHRMELRKKAVELLAVA